MKSISTSKNVIPGQLFLIDKMFETYSFLKPENIIFRLHGDSSFDLSCDKICMILSTFEGELYVMTSQHICWISRFAKRSWT